MPRIVTVTVTIPDSEIRGRDGKIHVNSNLIVNGWDRDDSIAAQIVQNALEDSGLSGNVWNVRH